MTVSALYVYPVKGAAGTSVEAVTVAPRGFAGDRRWMVVDADGRFMTQRTRPRMALVRPRLLPEGLRLEAPGMEPLQVARPPADARRIEVEIWKDRVAAVPAERSAHTWWQDFLGVDVRLVYMPPDTRRPVDPAYGRAGDQVSFADGYPVLLATEASLADLNRRLAEPVPMNRFRPNVVVRGSGAFEEDTWQAVRIGEAAFRVVKPCARCVVTTVDQSTGAPGREPLATLARFRKRDGKVFFGQNLIPDAASALRVGDPVVPAEAGVKQG